MTSYPSFGPVEDLMIGILRPFFAGKGVTVYPEYEEGMQLPAVVPIHSRRSGTTPFSGGDIRFTQPAIVEMNTICDGPDSDDLNADLQEACRIALVQAWMKQTVIPSVGSINRIDNSTKATHVSDWATSTGVVQYANLPAGANRYEAVYRLILRPPIGGAPNRFLDP